MNGIRSVEVCAGLALAAAALARPCAAVETFVTQYIAPASNPTWEARVTNTTYGADEPFVFARENCGYHVNYRLDVAGRSCFAFQDWIRVYGHDADKEFFYYPTNMTRGVSDQRYLYPFSKKTFLSGAVEWYPYNSKEPRKERKIDIPQGTFPDEEIMYVLDASALNRISRELDLGTVTSYAAYAQGVQTDYVYRVTFTLGGAWIGGAWTPLGAADGHGGTMPDQLVTNTARLASCAFTNDCCDFVKWAVPDNDGRPGEETYKVGDLIEPKEDLTLMAVWTPHDYTVKFDANGGTGDVMPSQAFRCHVAEPLPKNTFTRDGYAFAGWADADGNVYTNQAVVMNLTTTAGGVVTLRAAWAFDVKFNANDGEGKHGAVTLVTGGRCPTLPDGATFTRRGYAFAGWNDRKDGSGVTLASGEIVALSSNCTVYAQWTPAALEVAFSGNGHGTVEGEEVLSVGNRYVTGQPFGELPVAVASNGYLFAGWWTTADYAQERRQVLPTDVVDPAFVKLDEAGRTVPFYARWKRPGGDVPTPATCRIAFDPDGGDLASADSNRTAVVGKPLGKLPTPTHADDGLLFIGWFTAQEGGTAVTAETVATEDATYYARWSLRWVNDQTGLSNIAFRCSGDVPWCVGEESGTLRSGALGKGKNAILEALLPSDGTLSFRYWIKDDNTHNNIITVIADESEILTAFGIVSDSKTVPHGVARVSWTWQDSKGFKADADNLVWISLTWTPDGSSPDDPSPTPEPSPAASELAAWDVQVDHPEYAFATGGDAAWGVTAQAGCFFDGSNGVAAVAGLADGEATWVTLATNGPGVASFAWRASCEPGYVGTNGVYVWCDRLEVTDGGAVTSRFDGADFVTCAVTNFGIGAQVLSWRYVKDGSETNFEDRAFLDEVTWTPLPVYPLTVAGVETNVACGAEIVLEGPADVTADGTNVTCVGWRGTGDVPASGAGRRVAFTVTQTSALDWVLATNYWIAASSGRTDAGAASLKNAAGKVQATNALWAAAGTRWTAVATAGKQGKFQRWTDGATGAALGTKTTLALVADRPRTVVAQFARTVCAVRVALCDGCAGMGKVSGGKSSVKTGTKLTLKATAAKAYVFAGWFADVAGATPWTGSTDYRKASYAYVATGNDVTLYAKFIAKSADWASLRVDCASAVELARGLALGSEGTIAPIAVAWDGGSLPTLKVSGLPTGLKCASGRVYGKPTKSGRYTTTFAVKTAGLAATNATVRFTVLDRAKERVVLAVCDAAQGRVSGSGVYAQTKKVTLKAVALRGWAFVGWWRDGVRVSRAASYAAPAGAEDVTYEARFVTLAEDRDSIAASLDGVPLAPWLSKTQTQAFATNVWAGVALVWPVAFDAASAPSVKVTGLPAGLSYVSSARAIRGVPTTASKAGKPSVVKLSVTTSGGSSRLFQVNLTVTARPAWAAGTFAGPSYAEGDNADDFVTNGVASVTVAANGKISAKHLVAGRSVSFSASGFDRYEPPAADEAFGAFHATLVGKVGKVAYTNELLLGAWTAEADGVGVTNGAIAATWFDATRYSWKSAPWKALAKGLAGTEAYDVAGDAPGRVTLKVSTDGTAKAAGVFSCIVKGKAKTYKASVSTVLCPVATEAGGVAYRVVIYFAPNTAKGFPGHCRVLDWPPAEGD